MPAGQASSHSTHPHLNIVSSTEDEPKQRKRRGNEASTATRMKLSLLMVLVAVLAQVKPGSTCGYSEDLMALAKSTGRIVGGTQVKDCSVIPWQVRLMIKVGGDVFLCGGSIISDIHILTAAHCLDGVRNNNQVKVHLGDYDLHVTEPEEVVFDIKNFTSHDDYDPRTKAADIAILTLAKPLDWGDCTRGVCMYPFFDLNGETCIVSGWGDTTWKGTNSRYLLMVKVQAYDGTKCNAEFDVTDTNYVKVPEKMICAGHKEGGKDSCQGDSGGPLVCLRGNSFVQVGIVSYGRECAKKNFPGVYTRISEFEDWIIQVKSENPW